MHGLMPRLHEAREDASQLLAFMEDRDLEKRYREFPYYIPDLDFASILKRSEEALSGFATLDLSLAGAITVIEENLRDYLDDTSRRRPHNLLMLAAPGSGKSYLVKCLAESLNVPQVVGNLSAPDSVSVLSYVLNEARNFKAEDRVPLVFIDEVDSRGPLHYSTLLPLLWEGELFVSGQRMRLGRCMIICAANRRNLAVQHEEGEPVTETRGAGISKVEDFMSRFGAGILEIDSLSSEHRRLDTLVIAAKLIARRFPELKYVSLGLIQFFGYVQVEYGARSLECLVNLIPAGSIHAGSARSGGTCSIEPDEGFLSLSREWNGTFVERFGSCLQQKGRCTDPLRFHISAQNRDEALQLWNLHMNNIGLLKLSDR